MPKPKKPVLPVGEPPRLYRGTVRLGCWCCDRQDFDGITKRELAKLTKPGSGWREIGDAYADPDSVFDWETHRGTCPECAAEEDALDARLRLEWEKNRADQA